MKQTLLTICLILFALPSWGEALTIDDLVERDGLYYKKFSDVPFTGEISQGKEQGSFNNGKRNGNGRHNSNDGCNNNTSRKNK